MMSFQRIRNFFSTLFLYVALSPARVLAQAQRSEVKVDEGKIGFAIPSFGDLLTFLIRGFFVVAGVVALLFLMLGAFSWITSGGSKEGVEAARNKIQAALIGVILIIIVVAIVATLEQIVFAQRLCFGLTCAVTIPELLGPPGS